MSQELLAAHDEVRLAKAEAEVMLTRAAQQLRAAEERLKASDRAAEERESQMRTAAEQREAELRAEAIEREAEVRRRAESGHDEALQEAGESAAANAAQMAREAAEEAKAEAEVEAAKTLWREREEIECELRRAAEVEMAKVRAAAEQEKAAAVQAAVDAAVQAAAKERESEREALQRERWMREAAENDCAKAREEEQDRVASLVAAERAAAAVREKELRKIAEGEKAAALAALAAEREAAHMREYERFQRESDEMQARATLALAAKEAESSRLLATIDELRRVADRRGSDLEAARSDRSAARIELERHTREEQTWPTAPRLNYESLAESSLPVPDRPIYHPPSPVSCAQPPSPIGLSGSCYGGFSRSPVASPGLLYRPRSTDCLVWAGKRAHSQPATGPVHIPPLHVPHLNVPAPVGRSALSVPVAVVVSAATPTVRRPVHYGRAVLPEKGRRSDCNIERLTPCEKGLLPAEPCPESMHHQTISSKGGEKEEPTSFAYPREYKLNREQDQHENLRA